MTPRVLRAIGLGVVWALVLGAGMSAGARPETAQAPGPRPTLIQGAAWNADNSPIPHARLRLRNASTGRVEATTVADEEGQFVFADVETGTYVIELVSEYGRVLALGHTLYITRGETVTTLVRLGARVSGLKGFFINAAAAASSTAASTGVTAIAPQQVRPASGRR